MSDPKRPDDRSDPLDLRLEPVAAPPAEHPSRPAAPPVKERDPFEQLRQETFGPPPEVPVVSPEDPAPEVPRASEPARTPATPAPVTPTPVPAAAPTAAGDVATRRLIAGLLAIVLGWLGAHKFYLGMTRPGVTVAGLLALSWLVTTVLTVISAGLLGFLLAPIMGVLFSALVILGIVEGVIYLSRSDADFERTYLRGKKPWL